MYKLGRLIPLESDIKGLPKTRWYHVLLRRAKLIRIIADIEKIKNAVYPIWTDDKAETNTDNSYTILTQTIRRYKCAIA